MRTYIIVGKVRAYVESCASQFADQKGGQAGPVESCAQVRCDDVDDNTSIDNSGVGGVVYMCRVDY